MRFNCTSLWNLFSDKHRKTLLPYIFASSIKTSCSHPLYYTLIQRILSTLATYRSPHFLPLRFSRSPSQLTVSALFLAPFSLNIRFYSLLSSLSSPLYLSICLSVCPSLATSHAHSHDQSATQVRITLIHLVHSLAHSPTRSRSHTGWVSFFIPYTVIVRM